MSSSEETIKNSIQPKSNEKEAKTINNNIFDQIKNFDIGFKAW